MITFKKLSNLNFGPSNGDCTEEMRVQMESPLPNNQPSHFTIANTSTNENKIDNLSSTMFKQQKPLFNSSQFCYYPMPFVEPAFQSGAESGNGYYGNFLNFDSQLIILLDLLILKYSFSYILS